MKKYLVFVVVTVVTFFKLHSQVPVLIKEFGAAGHDLFNDIELDQEGNIIVSGTSASYPLGASDTLVNEGFVAKFDSAGVLQWIIPAGDAVPGLIADYFMAPVIALDDDGNIYLCGYENDSARIGNVLLTDAGDYNFFLAKIGSSGNIIWTKTCASPVLVNGIEIDQQNNLVIGGILYGVADFEGIILTPFGGYGSADAFVVKYDSAGTFKWVRQAGGTGFYGDGCQDVGTDSNGNVFITGDYRSDADFDGLILDYHGTGSIYEAFVAKYDSAGQILWAKPCGEHSFALAVDPSGNCYVSGASIYIWTDTGAVSTGPGYSFLNAKFSSAGDLEWFVYDSSVFSSNYSQVSEMISDPNGNIYSAGAFYDSLVIDGFIPHSSSCGDDTPNVPWFFELSPSGSLLFNNNFQTCGELTGLASYSRSVAISDCRLAYCGVMRDAILFSMGNDTIESTNGGYDAFILVYDLCVPTSIPNVINVAEPHIFPNPFTSTATIIINDAGVFDFMMYDLYGREVMQLAVSSQQSTMSRGNLPAGIYFYTVKDDAKMMGSGKVVIE